MAKKNYKSNKKYSRKAKYTSAERRSYWTGYGIALERMKSSSPGYSTYGEHHLETGWMPSIDSANAGYNKAMSNRNNDYLLTHPFYPKEK